MVHPGSHYTLCTQYGVHKHGYHDPAYHMTFLLQLVCSFSSLTLAMSRCVMGFLLVSDRLSVSSQ